jgi:uncharacterized membrane protein
MLAYNFFTDDEKKKIAEAIKVAELNTSGEIRVHVEGQCKADVLDCAAYWFKKLKMHQTERRNGVLFYLAVNDHKFAIIGDAGINSKVPDNFWELIKEHMKSRFVQGQFADGLTEGILMAGEQLKAHFPYQDNDTNELTDDISFG